MKGTLSPGPAQKVNDNNLKLLKGTSVFSWRNNNNFINPPKLKSEMTLDLLRQLSQIKKERVLKDSRLKRKIVVGIMLISTVLSIILFLISH